MQIQYGANFKIKGKTSANRLSYAGAFIPTKGSIKDLADHIESGFPWMPAILDEDSPRWQHKANYAELVAIDVDNEIKKDGKKIYHHQMTVEEALSNEFIKKHCALGIPSASHKDGWHKHRLTFRYFKPIIGWQNIRICNRYLMHLLGVADEACKDASRYFFGAPGKKPFLINEEVTLPETFLEDALKWNQEIEAEEARQQEETRKRWEEWRSGVSEKEANALLLQALTFIDPDCDYNYWIAVGMALRGIGDEMFTAWDNWSSGSKSYNSREMGSRWKSFRNVVSSPAVIFGLAKRNGFRIPKKVKATNPKGFQKSIGIQIQNKLASSDTIAFTFGTLQNVNCPIIQAKDEWFGDTSASYRTKLQKELKQYKGSTAIIFGAWPEAERLEDLGTLVSGLGFELKYAVEGEAFDPEQFSATKFLRKIDNSIKEEEQRLSALTFAPTVKLNQKYLSDIILDPEKPLILVSSPTGSGKTEQLISLRDQALLRNKDAKIINISYRNALSRQTSERVGLTHIHDVSGDVTLEQAYSQCIDSILKIKLESITEGSLLFFDEVEAVLSHVLLGSTCKDKRAAILSHLKAVIETVLSKGGNVVAMEADLTDISVKLFLNLCNNCNYELIVNEFQSIKFPINIIKDGDKNSAYEYALRILDAGKRFMFVSNVQGACEEAHKFLQKQYPNASILRVDGKTSETQEVKEYLKDLNKATDDLNLSVLIVSPSLESGGNITSEAYDEMVFFFSNIGVRKANQMLSRLRTSVPRTGVIKNNSLLHQDSKWLFVGEILEHVFENALEAERVAKSLQHESYARLSFELAMMGKGNVVDNLISIQNWQSANAIFLRTAIEMQARENCSSVRLEKSFVEYYSDRGFDIQWIELEKSEEVKEIIKEVKAEIKEDEITEFEKADHTLTEEQSRKIQEAPTSTREERIAATKSNQFRRFEGEIDLNNREMIEAVFIRDNGRFVGKVEKLAMFLNPEKAKNRFFKEIDHVEDRLLTDMRHDYTHILAMREKLCIHEGLLLTEEFDEQHPVIQKILRLAQNDPNFTKRVAKCSVTNGTTAISFFSNVLKTNFGLTLCSKRVGGKRDQKKVYWIDFEKDQAHAAILKALAKKLLNEHYSPKPQKHSKVETKAVDTRSVVFQLAMDLQVA